MDRDDPENYGFSALMRHPDGETYGCLIKGSKDIVEAAKGYACEEREHGVQCVRIDRWERWQLGVREDILEQIAKAVDHTLDPLERDSYVRLVQIVREIAAKV